MGFTSRSALSFSHLIFGSVRLIREFVRKYSRLKHFVAPRSSFCRFMNQLSVSFKSFATSLLQRLCWNRDSRLSWSNKQLKEISNLARFLPLSRAISPCGQGPCTRTNSNFVRRVLTSLGNP